MTGFDYDSTKQLNFCELCVEGKQHQNLLQTNYVKRAGELLGLVHSDVYGKKNEKSLIGAEYIS